MKQAILSQYISTYGFPANVLLMLPPHEISELGGQVRFGVLNAGNFGVSQSRKRTFIWGVAPDNDLPAWPAPLHVFRSPQLTISLPGDVKARSVNLTIPSCILAASPL